ncbi:anthranilate synthase component I family protein [Acinetobacter wuhouensis]|uniref:anthranilate synthase component I family protein n=1 Tax=Acinetobacter TaxID=469 RepID=UPI00083AAB4E|nr:MULTISPECIES: anthranilate synthase component I family protein [Acinetobacter]AXQ21415.1 anthranilate synthase component I family protein [Acinetobacter wuhouensis]RZG78752.1 anthranilate synthase component I family protein [Acinetobacter sp. WCHAc060033]
MFRKLLNFPSNQVSQLLLKLNTLTGVNYLANLGENVISFLPESYCIYIKQQQFCYSRNNLFQYQLDNKKNQLNDFLNFSAQHCIEQRDSFQGGYIGFIDYNYASNQQIDSNLKNQPNFYIGIYKTFIKLENGHFYFYSTESCAVKLFHFIQNILNNSQDSQSNFSLKAPCTATWTKQQYQHAFKRVQNYIKAGDCYQINLTQEFTTTAQGSLLDTAEKFWQLTDAPYSGYLKIDDFELLSCSPELFIDFEANRKITTKPIKGTMPRYDDPVLDEQSKNTLTHSQKDQAENVMIVDLLRNDLSVYAETGSVKTPKLFNIESFNQVHHMVSEVTAILKEDVNPFEMLLSALPGGSITGAPKIRAMQIIEELEGAPRGAYCGSMGYFNFDGTGSWNILIRSIQKYQDNVSLWAGGGITIASDCDAEYQECFDKVSAMLDLLNTWYQPENTQEKSES